MTSSFYSHLGCENKYICVVQIDPERWNENQGLSEKLSLFALLLSARSGCFVCWFVFPPTLQLGQIWLCLVEARAEAVSRLLGRGERSGTEVLGVEVASGLAGWLPQHLPGPTPSPFLGSWLTLAVGCWWKRVSMAIYQCCLLPPQHSASHSLPLPLLTPLPSPPVSQACCHGKVIIHKEFQIPPHPLGFGFLVWFFFSFFFSKVCSSV